MKKLNSKPLITKHSCRAVPVVVHICFSVTLNWIVHCIKVCRLYTAVMQAEDTNHSLFYCISSLNSGSWDSCWISISGIYRSALGLRSMQIGLFLSLKTEVHLILLHCGSLCSGILYLDFYFFWLILLCCLNLLKHIHREYSNANQPHAANVNSKVNYNKLVCVPPENI